jgi:microcin C transport system substrate-binding protein
MKNHLLVVGLVATLIISTPFSGLAAKASHGLSLYGPQDLKYKPGEPYRYGNPKAPKGGYLTLSAFGAFTKLTPMSLKGVPAPFIELLVFQTPMDGSADDSEHFSQYGSLVEKVELADDHLSMVYHIRKNAKFSDGKPVTADDFVFSFDLIKNEPEFHPFYKHYFADIKTAEKLGSHRVKYTFAFYNQELPLIVGQMSILPKHIYGQKGKKFGSDFDDIAVGSGPYTVKKYEFGKYITYQRNPNWWGKDLAINKGRYNFDEITAKVYLDPVAMREAFKGGEYDFNLVNSSRDWALDYKGDFVKKGYYSRKEFPHTRVSGMQGFAMNMRNPIFKSRKVRAAIAMVMDFDWSNQNLFYNQYTRNDCYFDNNPELKPKGLPEGEVKELLLGLRKKHGKEFVPKTVFTKPVGAPGQGIPIEKNIALANKLLDSEGWKRGADGFRQKKGQRLKFEILLVSPLFQRIVEPFKNNLKKIGVELTDKLVQVAQYEERLREFKYDMVVANFPQSRSPGNEQRSMWTSEAVKVPGSRNYMGIENPAVNELVDIIVKAKTRKDLVNAIQAMDRILTHQFYIVPHWFISLDRIVHWNKFSHPKIIPSASSRQGHFMEWWWYDEAKAEKLKKAMASGKPLK